MYGRENRLKVARDEAKHAEAEKVRQEKQQQVQLFLVPHRRPCPDCEAYYSMCFLSGFFYYSDRELATYALYHFESAFAG